MRDFGEWPMARGLLRPVLRPIGSEAPELVAGSLPGAAGLPVLYVVSSAASPAPVDARDLEAWGVEACDVEAAAMENLAAWDDAAGWVSEGQGPRRMVWSESGEGLDAARILLPGVREHLADEFGSSGRVLVAMPERDLLIATGVSERDPEFEEMFADYVAERSSAAEEPIDPRVFELIGGELVDSEAAVAA